MGRIFVSVVIAGLAGACGGSGDSPAADGGTSGGASGGSATAGASSGGSSSGSSAGADASASSGGQADASSQSDAALQGNDAGAADAGAGLTCDPREILCKAAETPCPAGQVHEVIQHCYGPCVPITDCPCDAPEACPHSEEFTCWNHTGHCNYYGP